MAVAAHRTRLPLSFFHQIPSPPCQQSAQPALPTIPKSTVGATGNNAGEHEGPDLKPPLLSGEGGPRDGGGAGAGGNWPPFPGTSAVGLYQGDDSSNANVHCDGGSPGGGAGGLEQEEAAGGEGAKRTGDEGSGAGTDSGTFCMWRRCLVKELAAAEVRHTGDVAVVVEWDDEVGGQVRREGPGHGWFSATLAAYQCHYSSLMIPAALVAGAV